MLRHTKAPAPFYTRRAKSARALHAHSLLSHSRTACVACRNAAKTATTRSVQLSRKAVALMKQYQPAYCLSFWEPSIASMLDVMNAPTKVVAVASQVRTRSCCRSKAGAIAARA